MWKSRLFGRVSSLALGRPQFDHLGAAFFYILRGIGTAPALGI